MIIIKFKEWVIENNCEQVAVESTGVYWVPIHTVLENKIEVIVANAFKIKHTPGRKTDMRDSEWLAELCLNGMIQPSRIFPNEDRELRTLTRARESLVNNTYSLIVASPEISTSNISPTLHKLITTDKETSFEFTS
jgi:transposase